MEIAPQKNGPEPLNQLKLALLQHRLAEV